MPVNAEFTEIIPANGENVIPAVTICNLNRFVNSKINMPESEENFYKLGLNLSACEAMKKVSQPRSQGLSSYRLGRARRETLVGPGHVPL